MSDDLVLVHARAMVVGNIDRNPGPAAEKRRGFYKEQPSCSCVTVVLAKTQKQKAMAPNPQSDARPKTLPRNRALAYRASDDLSGSLIAVLAIIAFAVALSLVLTTDWSSTSKFPTVGETLPAPDIHSNVPPVPSKAPPPAQSKS